MNVDAREFGDRALGWKVIIRACQQLVGQASAQYRAGSLNAAVDDPGDKNSKRQSDQSDNYRHQPRNKFLCGCNHSKVN